MKVHIILVGRSKQAFVRPAIDEYRARCQRYVTLRETVFPEGRGGPEQTKQMEAASILKAMGDADYSIVLDERGKQLSTREFASKWAEMQQFGYKEVCLVVGGAFGVTEEVRRKADLVLALSMMTFPHQFVRAVLYEQLYRIFTVLRNEPYHH